MPLASRMSLAVCLCAFLSGSFFAGLATAAPTIWTGPDLTFSKAASADPTAAANQDHLTDNVSITRGGSQGIFNAAAAGGDCGMFGCSYSHGLSPADTMWANDLTSPDQTITATNFAALTFTDWEDAYGGSGNLQFNIVSRPAVVHLVSEDIYLNLQFTSWGGGGSGGAFTYVRSTAATAPTPTGDYNGDGVVDAADYTIWRGTFGQTVSSGAGADGNGNGMIDSSDYDFWKARFGNSIAGAGSGAALSAAVPEPTSLALSALGGLSLAAVCGARQIRKRAA
jgi:Dockerin type I domain